MLEYVFFEKTIRDKFVSFLSESSVEHRIGDDSLTILVSEDVDDVQGDVIDHCYESLLQETAELMEQGEDALEKDVAGVQILLKDGSVCTVRLNPELVSRILTCISMEEMRDMIQDVANWVEVKDNSPLCHTVKLEK